MLASASAKEKPRAASREQKLPFSYILDNTVHSQFPRGCDSSACAWTYICVRACASGRIIEKEERAKTRERRRLSSLDSRCLRLAARACVRIYEKR